MKLLAHILGLCLALAPALSDHAAAAPDRCESPEMDAVTVNEEGTPYFFKGKHMFKGFHGKAELSSESFTELKDHHQPDHVDAAFRMHHEKIAVAVAVDVEDTHDNNHTHSDYKHDNMYFLMDHVVFSYNQHKLEDGYPKNISEVFPGLPDHLDAAVECPKSECDGDTVIFFKENKAFHFNLHTKAVEEKEFKSMHTCTSAFRFMEHYYCLHGHMFSKFDPKTGEVHGKYPRDMRDYFMRCSKFSNESDHVERERCSRVHLDAITSDNDGNIYAFRAHHFLHIDNDTFKADTIESAFKELHSEVDAVFSYEDHLYMIKDENLHVYKVGEPHTHLDGYPKPVKDELGIEGHVDAAFMCENSNHTAHIIQGKKIFDVDMQNRAHGTIREREISAFDKVDTVMCGPEGLKVIVGNHFYHYESVMTFVASRAQPVQHRVSLELFGCDH